MSVDDIARPASDDGQDALFHVDKSWTDVYWGLPEFSAVDRKPTRELVLQFLTNEDFQRFRQVVDIDLRAGQKSTWWPKQNNPQVGEYHWQGTPSPSRYPVYIPSKGRYDVASTPALLDQAGVDYKLVVEPPEADQYCDAFGADKVLELPFHDLGQGSIPARNWIWEHAQDNGHPWHWIIDDNIVHFARSHHNRRLVVRSSSAPLRMVEDFADRYDNLAFAGLSDRGFQPDNSTTPISLNTRVYSMTLIRTDLPYRWRGRYNEDTDLCLRALKDGWATALFRSLLMFKHTTARGDGTGGLKGGNTDNVYNTGDYRRRFAESLREQHPDCVQVVWKFNRWHHEVDYSRFRRNELRLRPNVTPIGSHNNYGLELVRTKNTVNEHTTTPPTTTQNTHTDDVEDW